MEPNIWGPGAWTFLHSITLNYPNHPTLNQKKIYSDFFNLLGKVLPCMKCQYNYQEHLKNYPINFHLDSKEKLSRWLVKIHNMTNKETGKKEITYQQFLKEIDEIYDSPEESITYYKAKNDTQRIILIFFIAIIAILSLYIYIKSK